MSDSSDPLVCYTIGYNFVTSSNQYFPCGSRGSGGNGTSSGGAQSCCFAGDYCMEDSICHYTHSVTNGTGYYMAGCTDKTWQDPACPKQCTSEYGADIIYDTTNDQWNCCFSRDGFLNCQQPSDFIVQAPAPAKLQTQTQLNTPVPSATLTQIGSISSYLVAISTISQAPDSSSAASTHATASPSFSPLPSQNSAASATSTSSAGATSSSSSGAGISGGAIAGIVVGAIAGVTLLLIAALLLYRWNKRNNAAIREHEWNGNRPGASELGENGTPSIFAHHQPDKPHQPPSYGGQSPGGAVWTQGQSPRSWSEQSGAGGGMSQGWGAQGMYHELSAPKKEDEQQQQQQPAELMASPGRDPAELGDGRKSALS